MKKLRNVHCICCDAFVVLISSKERAAAKEPPNEEQYRLILVNERACIFTRLWTGKIAVLLVQRGAWDAKAQSRRGWRGGAVVVYIIMCRLDLAGMLAGRFAKAKSNNRAVSAEGTLMI